MINSNRGSISDKVLLSGMGFAVIGAMIVMGIWFFCNSEKSTGSGGSSKIETFSSHERIDVFVKNSINDLENMGLLELINLKEMIVGFRERGKMDFEIDTSGILEIFK